VKAISGDSNINAIISVLSVIEADVLLLGMRALQPDTVAEVEIIREQFPDLGIVLLVGTFEIQDIKQLREFARRNPYSWAFLQKHSIDNAVKLTHLLQSIAEGHVVLDPVVMEAMIETGDTGTAFLKQLTDRELQILNWMTRGYRNDTIAQVLCVDPQVVERHLNTIYSKLDMGTTSKHPRVNAATLYLKAIGQLSGDDTSKM
ncbi:MAG: response regulator transcription factor, partial [Chloroflexi bacterium]|nr:response regulator transcription factor [Chloroflexota bacterium]